MLIISFIFFKEMMSEVVKMPKGGTVCMASGITRWTDLSSNLILSFSFQIWCLKLWRCWRENTACMPYGNTRWTKPSSFVAPSSTATICKTTSTTAAEVSFLVYLFQFVSQSAVLWCVLFLMLPYGVHVPSSVCFYIHVSNNDGQSYHILPPQAAFFSHLVICSNIVAEMFVAWSLDVHLFMHEQTVDKAFSIYSTCIHIGLE